MHLSSQQLDRAVGAVVGSAVGDALGAPYEFGSSHDDDFFPEFGPGMGGEAPGQWTDDTAMAISILEALAAGLDIDSEAGIQEVIDRWYAWAEEDGRGIGIQTARVMDRASADRTERGLLRAAEELHLRTGRSAGNGSLMRIGPLALGHLEAAPALRAAAERVTRLTHWEPDNGAAVGIWAQLIREAVLTGELDITAGLVVLDGETAPRWMAFIGEALDADHPRDFADRNGWVVGAFQAALNAVHGATDFPDAIHSAVRGGRDTDTVAAIAGALAGARWGVSQIPLAWQRRIHGWPGYRANDLARLAVLAARRGASDSRGWPAGASVLDETLLHTAPVRHPSDDGVWLGSQSALGVLPDSVGAVVSLARVGTEEVPAGLESVRVWLVDAPGANRNLERTLADAADVIAALRAEGLEVFVHCAEARSRTAAVAALYAARHRGSPLDEAWAALDGRSGSGVLPHFAPAPFLQDAVARILTKGED